MKTISYFLAVASWVMGLITLILEYAKRNQWPDRGSDNSDSDNSGLDIHAQKPKESSGHDFKPTEGTIKTNEDKGGTSKAKS